METERINSEIYRTLGENWYTATNDPVALLRAESRHRNPVIAGKIQSKFENAHVLDVGCGAGFLSNDLAGRGFRVTGIDLEEKAIEVARAHDFTGQVNYLTSDALHLPFEDESYDVVCTMDLLEHVEEPALLIAECSRVLKPGGLFFFSTFNRNPISWLMAIKAVEWRLKKTPKNLHIHRMFIKPSELDAMCQSNQLRDLHLKGTGPRFDSFFWKSFLKGDVDDRFSFEFKSLPLIGYFGWAEKAE